MSEAECPVCNDLLHEVENLRRRVVSLERALSAALDGNAAARVYLDGPR